MQPLTQQFIQHCVAPSSFPGALDNPGGSVTFKVRLDFLAQFGEIVKSLAFSVSITLEVSQLFLYIENLV